MGVAGRARDPFGDGGQLVDLAGLEQVDQDLRRGLLLSAPEALDYGLVTAVH